MASEGIASKVRAMNPPRYTTTEAAKKIGRSVDTIVRWRKDGVYHPSDSQEFGQVKVWLYSEDDIVHMKAMCKQIKPGRKPAA